MKTIDQLKQLRPEDFMAPNQVLCYGAGEAFIATAPYMLSCGFNLAGVIDAYKTGSIELRGKKFPVFSIEQASKQFGGGTRIVITIADEKVAQQVEQALVQSGFDGDQIFDLNVWTWLTIPSEKSYCNNLSGFMLLMCHAWGSCCPAGDHVAYVSEWFIRGRPLEQSAENFFQKRAYYIAESKKGRIPLFCRNCSSLERRTEECLDKIHTVALSDHAYCNADCVYCSDACSLPKATRGIDTFENRHEMSMKVLDALREKDLFCEQRPAIQCASGEITIYPYKQQLYRQIRELHEKRPDSEARFYSNCFLYDQEIADILALNKNAFLLCDLDAGTPETYIKVKGFNKFYDVREHLKKYSQHGTVKLKYIVLPGFNDSDADYQGTVELLKYLGLTELTISAENALSWSSDKLTIRAMVFSAARLMAALERNGLHASSLSNALFWTEHNIAIVKRLCRELRALESPSEPQ